MTRPSPRSRMLPPLKAVILKCPRWLSNDRQCRQTIAWIEIDHGEAFYDARGLMDSRLAAYDAWEAELADAADAYEYIAAPGTRSAFPEGLPAAALLLGAACPKHGLMVIKPRFVVEALEDYRANRVARRIAPETLR